MEAGLDGEGEGLHGVEVGLDGEGVGHHDVEAGHLGGVGEGPACVEVHLVAACQTSVKKTTFNEKGACQVWNC